MVSSAVAFVSRPFQALSPSARKSLGLLLLAAIMLAFPLIHDDDADIDTAANALSYATLALGLNIVVGFAGLLDLGYAAFFAIGAYYYGILGWWRR
jgi:branched-chain amino acid transport system permease protein